MVLWEKAEVVGKLHFQLKHGDLQQDFSRLLANCSKNLDDFLLNSKIQEANMSSKHFRFK